MKIEDFEDIKRSGLIEKRATALGPNVRDKCTLKLEQTYKRLWLGLEIISWNQPSGFSGWILRKFGLLTRQDGLDLLDNPLDPVYLEHLWEKHGPKPEASRFFYWRTALIGQYIVARNRGYIPVKVLDWLEEQDPLLYIFLSNYGRVIQSRPGHEDLLALGYHYDLECRQGKPVSLGDVLLEFNFQSLLEYMNYPETGNLMVREITSKERANAREN